MKRLWFILLIVVLLPLLLVTPAVAAYPIADDPTWGFDPAWDAITLIHADLAPGEVGWCAFYGAYNSNSWDHSINIYVVDRSVDGVIEDGGRVVVRNEANGFEGQMGIKPIPEWQDWPSYKNDDLTVRMVDDLGRKSDVIKLIRQVPKTGAMLPPEYNLYHLGRNVGVRKCVSAEETETPTPVPTVLPTSTPDTRQWEITGQTKSKIVIELK